ncbi:hypothetical protein HMPREF9193_01654 [Treponema lecithinolyticum ATCC 700332]|uniref:Uncharacterized protein n=1 Tax=Treponema lecithinolyticum ATCC 700332 TaxID=1321815 RepID=A0ABN0NX82_TRELE|nr:hypothetical protein HMPREF9193_01654 [Treponema lecithinolyticum ATCC 700332]
MLLKFKNTVNSTGFADTVPAVPSISDPVLSEEPIANAEKTANSKQTISPIFFIEITPTKKLYGDHPPQTGGKYSSTNNVFEPKTPADVCSLPALLLYAMAFYTL